ncbi:MAG: GNAT family N-acetyltransferase [Haloferacaceae archaeon]
MDLREATTEDVDEIRTVATQSMTASYGHALGEEIIDAAVDRWYDEAQLGDDLADEDTVFVVAVENGTVVGFAQSYVVRRRDLVGEIDWLHVAPDHRGHGIGDQLLARVEQELVEHGVERIEARVLEENEAGAGFYEEHGFDRIGDRDVDIADRSFSEQLYSKFPEAAGGRQVLIESREGPDGQQLFIALDESERASKAPFYPAYRDRDREDRYGYFCSNCESFDVAVDSMERVECNECGNRRKPSRWDAAYL